MNDEQRVFEVHSTVLNESQLFSHVDIIIHADDAWEFRRVTVCLQPMPVLCRNLAAQRSNQTLTLHNKYRYNVSLYAKRE